MTKANDKKRKLLGEPLGTASGKLRRMLMFDLICKLELNACFRCTQPMAVDNYSIEHKVAWQSAEDPAKMFYDLDNIDFSHLRCNVGARNSVLTEHGTARMYRANKCRCDLCKKANTEAVQRYRKRKITKT